MNELKPCPFCGGEGVVQEHVFHGYSSTYGVVCFDCCAETKQFFTDKKVAIRAWNRRTADANGQKEVSDTLADHRK